MEMTALQAAQKGIQKIDMNRKEVIRSLLIPGLRHFTTDDYEIEIDKDGDGLWLVGPATVARLFSNEEIEIGRAHV